MHRCREVQSSKDKARASKSAAQAAAEAARAATEAGEAEEYEQVRIPAALQQTIVRGAAGSPALACATESWGGMQYLSICSLLRDVRKLLLLAEAAEYGAGAAAAAEGGGGAEGTARGSAPGEGGRPARVPGSCRAAGRAARRPGKRATHPLALTRNAHERPMQAVC